MNSQVTKNRVRTAYFALTAILSCALYIPFIGNPPVFDDWGVLAGGSLAHYATTPFNLQPRTFPYFTIGLIQTLTQSFEAQRLFNLTIHFFNSILIFILLTKSLSAHSKHPDHYAGFGALFFALHPVAVYGTAYLVQRTILFATLFTLLSAYFLIIALDSNNNKKLIIAAAMASLAMLSKEHAILSPLASIFISLPASTSSFGQKKRQFGLFITYCAPIIATVLLHSAGYIGNTYEPLAKTAEFGIDADLPWGNWITSIVLQSKLFFSYVSLWIIPTTQKMSIDLRPDIPTQDDLIWLVTLSLLSLSMLLFLFKTTNKKAFHVCCALLYTLTFFSIEFTTVRMQEPFVLYRSYLWAPGLIMIVTIFFSSLKPNNNVMHFLIAFLIISTVAYQATDRLSSLTSSTRMWADAEKKLSSHNAPGAYRILFNRGLSSLSMNDYPTALYYMETIIGLKPQFDGGHWGLAMLYMRQQRYEEGLLAAEKAIQISPSRTDLVALKARFLAKLGRTEEATALMDKIKDTNDLLTQVQRTSTE